MGSADLEPAELPAHEALACARAGASLLGSRRSCLKPLLVQTSLLLLGPHLFGCFSDDVPGVPNEKVCHVLLWEKPTGKKLQSREGRELVRSGRPLLGRKLEGVPGELTWQ